MTEPGRIIRHLANRLRRTAVPAFFLLVLFVGVGCTRPPFEARDSIDTFSGYLDGRIPRLMKQYGVPGVSVALVRGGEVVWSGAYGYADLEHSRKMTVDAVYRVESISKSVTAWGVSGWSSKVWSILMPLCSSTWETGSRRSRNTHGEKSPYEDC